MEKKCFKANFLCVEKFFIYLNPCKLDIQIVKTKNLKLQEPLKMKKFEEVKSLIAALEADADKFYNKGNSAAGTRIRKGMQDLKNLAQAIRLEVQDTKNKA